VSYISISIIIPVYNTERYLLECINSILNQSFGDYELLLVDDGSTDNSGRICDGLAEKDTRIRVFHKENGGVSSARNLGLDNARGVWVYFVDSDDEVLPGGLEALVNGISDDVDSVMGGYEQHGIDGSIIRPLDGYSPTILTKEQSLFALLSSNSMYNAYLGFMCLWLFRNKIIQDNHLRFDPNIKIKEDTLFVTQYLCASKGQTQFVPIPVYKYKLREASAMGALGQRYNPAYLTSMDAVIQMHSCIHQLPKVCKELSRAAKYEVVQRVYLIKSHMITVNAVDNSILLKFERKAIKEVGILYYLEYQYHRNVRRGKRIIKRILRTN
jgi:glycosyltransferase involved in cell wall biosynthesis